MFSSVYVGLIIDELTHCPYFVALSTVVFGITLFIPYKTHIKHHTGVLPDMYFRGIKRYNHRNLYVNLTF